MSRSPVPIANLLSSRSLYGRFPRTTGKRIYSFIPHRLAVPLCDLVESAPELATCILLGFSRTGSLIYSYNNNDDDGLYELQIWSIISKTSEPYATQLIGRAPLFKSINTNEIEEDDIGDELEIALFEAPGGRALVASAVSRSSSGTVTHISLLPGAACLSLATKPPSMVPTLGVEHFSYKVSNPFPRLRPACLTAVEGPGGAKHVLALNTGTGIVHISFTVEIAEIATTSTASGEVLSAPPARTGPNSCFTRGQRPFPPLLRATVSSPSSTKIPKARICMVTFVDADRLLPVLVNHSVVIDYDLRFVRLLPVVGGGNKSSYGNGGIDVSPSQQDDDGSLPGDAQAFLCAAVVDHEEAVEKVTALATTTTTTTTTTTRTLVAPIPPPSSHESSSDWAFVAGLGVSAPAQRTFGRRTTTTGTAPPLCARPLPLPQSITTPANDDDSLSPPSTASPNLSPRPSTGGGLLIRSLVMWRVNLFPSSSSVREQHVFSTLPAALQPGLDDVDGRDLAVVWREQNLTSRVSSHGAPSRTLPTSSSTSRELNNDAFVRGRSLRTIIAPTLPLAIIA